MERELVAMGRPPSSSLFPLSLLLLVLGLEGSLSCSELSSCSSCASSPACAWCHASSSCHNPQNLLSSCPSGLFSLSPAACLCAPQSDRTCEECTDVEDAGCVWIGPNASITLQTVGGGHKEHLWSTGRCWPGGVLGPADLVVRGRGTGRAGSAGGSCCPDLALDCCADGSCCPADGAAQPGFVYLDCCKGGASGADAEPGYELRVTVKDWYWGQCKAPHITMPRRMLAALLLMSLLACCCCACCALCCTTCQGVALVFCCPCYACLASIFGWGTPAGGVARGVPTLVAVGHVTSSHIGHGVKVMH
eukprot:scaffold275929_cov33-Tisochrysis_lutea.AAC.1